MANSFITWERFKKEVMIYSQLSAGEVDKIVERICVISRASVCRPGAIAEFFVNQLSKGTSVKVALEEIENV